jgi:hypothetical protein
MSSNCFSFFNVLSTTNSEVADGIGFLEKTVGSEILVVAQAETQSNTIGILFLKEL